MPLFEFKKRERLSSRKEIAALLEDGKHIFHYPFKAVVKEGPASSEACSAIVVSVPKKIFKHAVDMNLVKRRTREAYRLNRKILEGEGSYHVLFVYVARTMLDYQTICSGVCAVLNQLKQQ